jgi:hypothetical protein
LGGVWETGIGKFNTKAQRDGGAQKMERRCPDRPGNYLASNQSEDWCSASISNKKLKHLFDSRQKLFYCGDQFAAAGFFPHREKQFQPR